MIYINSVQDDTMEASLYASSATVPQEIEIDCNDGHTFSLPTGAVTGCAVRFKHEDDVAYTDIEAGAYDLSPFAGTRETFLIEFNPSAAANPQAVKFRVGPLVVPVEYSIVYNDSENEVYNDSESWVYTEI
jgi:hypothetical protein